jgi:DNA uptake protein ComE-like DNA-binding protein
VRSAKLRLAVAALGACASLAACGSTADQTNTTTSTASSASNGSGQTGKVSANTASASEITAALEAAGVSNAARWTREVMEYRPYAANDTGLTSLRQNLAKYNPGEDTITKIISALTP